MEKQVDKALIKKFIDNNCTADEIALIGRFLQEPGSDEIFEEILNQRWIESHEDTPVDQTQLRDWEARFKQKIAAYQPISQAKLKIPKYFRYAAVWSVMLLTLGGYGLYEFQQKNRPLAIIERSAPAGKLLKVTLPDSTVVFLNAASRLRYPKKFDGKTREVTLLGEAFFEVKHDSEHPFLVHADKLNIHVLGTSFNIRSYQNDSDIAVTVATGKVGVTIATRKETKASFLLPNTQLTYQKSSEKLAITTVDSQDSRAWETGSFIFNYETLENITRRLSRWYKVSFVYQNDKLPSRRFKLKLHNEDLKTVMESLSTAGDGFQYSIRGNQVIIK